ncbi:MAG: NINE protein [Bacteroidota bacterium]
MKNKYVASTLAFLFGTFGVHRFYLGQSVRGTLHFGLGFFTLMLTIVEGEPAILLPALIGFIDFVLFLVIPRAEFDEKYNKKYRAFTRPRNQAFYQDNRTDDYEQDSRVRRSNSRQRVNINPYKSSGVAKFNDYDYDGAIQDFKKALRHKYDDPALHFNLACCYSINEAADEAFFHIDKAISFGFVNIDKIHKHNALSFLRTTDEFEAFAKNGYRLNNANHKKTNDPSVAEGQNTKSELLTEQNDLLDQIVKLGELREKGILTEAEFQLQKEKLMNR